MTLRLGTATWLFRSVVLNNIETIDMLEIASNWRGNIPLFYLSAGIIKYKYSSIFLLQMVVIVLIILQIFFTRILFSFS